jgi:hypothetical protein
MNEDLQNFLNDDLTFDLKLKIVLIENFYKFYNLINIHKYKTVIVEHINIMTKCVFFTSPNEPNLAWVSPCFNLDEHD